MAQGTTFHAQRPSVDRSFAGRGNGKSITRQGIRRYGRGQITVLESIPTATLRLRVFRLANQGSVSEFLQEQRLDERSIDEIKALLQSRGIDDSLEELCDAPFRPKPRLQKAGYATRFSDGSFPVFYAQSFPLFQQFTPGDPPRGDDGRCQFHGSIRDSPDGSSQSPKKGNCPGRSGPIKRRGDGRSGFRDFP